VPTSSCAAGPLGWLVRTSSRVGYPLYVPLHCCRDRERAVRTVHAPSMRGARDESFGFHPSPNRIAFLRLPGDRTCTLAPVLGTEGRIQGTDDEGRLGAGSARRLLTGSPIDLSASPYGTVRPVVS
jgi:hypothetical protein